MPFFYGSLVLFVCLVLNPCGPLASDRIKLNMMKMKKVIVGEPKSRIVQKHTFFAPERYTAGILYTDSLNSA